MSPERDIAQRLEAIINTAIDGIITINSKGIIEKVNPAVSTLFQYSKEELIGQNISMLMPKKHSVRHDKYISNYLHTKKAKIIGIGRDVEGLRKDGTVFPFSLAVSEVILNDRIIFTGIIHDNSGRIKAEKDLVTLNNELEFKIAQRTEELEKAINILLKTNRQLEIRENELKASLERERELGELKSRFVSTASHEFRTPLSTILSSTSLISRYDKTEQQEKREKHIKKIKSAVDNLTGILNDFLSLSKLEEGKLELTNTEFNLKLLVEDIFSELSGVKKAEQNLIDEIPDDINLITDKRTLKNILFNLVSNAIKYSGKGDITIFARSITDKVVIDVSDQGIGIPESEQKHLFSRFFRASNVENIQGTGLGLSIVKRYVELLEGKIFFKSVENKGTTFSLTIPKVND